jgi:predicted RNA-binding Zn ribbon-like protein
MREHLDAVFRSLARGRDAPSTSIGPLVAFEGASLSRAMLLPADGGFTWSWRVDHSLERPLGPVVHAAIELLTNGPLDRVKSCGGCSFLFLDESKNRSRRWCSMDDCGSAEKVRRFVARRRQSVRTDARSSATRRLR